MSSLLPRWFIVSRRRRCAGTGGCFTTAAAQLEGFFIPWEITKDLVLSGSPLPQGFEIPWVWAGLPTLAAVFPTSQTPSPLSELFQLSSGLPASSLYCGHTDSSHWSVWRKQVGVSTGEPQMHSCSLILLSVCVLVCPLLLSDPPLGVCYCPGTMPSHSHGSLLTSQVGSLFRFWCAIRFCSQLFLASLY